MQDPQSMPGTFCPLNNFGIADYDRLHMLEAPAAHRRQLQLEDRPVLGSFDSAHLQKIHWFLFRDVFPWAGKFRLVHMSKVGGAEFGAPQFIASALQEVTEKLARENRLHGLSKEAFAERAGYYLGEINAIHPFREGNGRTQREFLRQLGVYCGHILSWEGIPKELNTSASIRSHTKGDNSGLVEIVKLAIEKGEAES